MARKRVSIIYTGGTLGMRQSADGYVPAPDLGALIHERMPELGDESLPDFDLMEYATPLESANATPRDWYDLAGRIRETADRFDGFVVVHGTDTMAYTASALSFLLADLAKPIILTGSQIPLCEVRSDAQHNLLSALQAIGSGRIDEVAVCFGPYILRGNRTTKVTATELDAFDSPNLPALAEIGTDIRFAAPNGARPRDSILAERPPAYHDCSIGVLRLFPGIEDAMIDAIVEAGACGIVLRCYGTGTAPTAHDRFLDALKRATAAGVVIVAVSQCQEGSVSLRKYAAGSALADAGVLSGFDMTTEAAFTKMHALFALELDRPDLERSLQQNLCGELTDS